MNTPQAVINTATEELIAAKRPKHSNDGINGSKMYLGKFENNPEAAIVCELTAAIEGSGFIFYKNKKNHNLTKLESSRLVYVVRMAV